MHGLVDHHAIEKSHLLDQENMQESKEKLLMKNGEAGTISLG